MSETIKAHFKGLHGDNLNLGIFDETIDNAYDGCFMCSETLKGMIKADPSYSKLIVFEGEDGFIWSEKPLEGDMSKTKTLQEDYAKLEITCKRLEVEKANAQAKVAPLESTVEDLKGQVAGLITERDQYKGEITKLQAEIKRLEKPAKP